MFRKLLSAVLVMCLLVAAIPVSAFAADWPFSGVDQGALYHLNTADHLVYISGSNDRFRPDASITRAEVAKIIYELLEEEPAASTENIYPDVEDGKWYTKYVLSLAEMGILRGFMGTLRPLENVTRAELVSLLTRFFDPVETADNFEDVLENSWAYGAIAQAKARGWIAGYEDGTFRPDHKITRAEAVTIINKALGREADRSALNGAGNPDAFMDVTRSHWAYYNIAEAAFEHDYEKTENEMGAEIESWASFEARKLSLAPGYHVMDGELYCVDENRQLVRNKTIGVLTFNAEGKYTSGNAELDTLLTRLVKAHTDPSASRLTNLKTLYEYEKRTYPYLNRSYINVGATGWEPDAALTMIKTGKGNCYNYAGLFTMMARKMGYQAKGVSGFVRVRNVFDWVRHGWVEINEGGTTYVCDPEFEGVYAKNRNLNWDLFMKKYGTMPSQYQGVNGFLG